jgi:hypothetical protein
MYEIPRAFTFMSIVSFVLIRIITKLRRAHEKSG